MINSGIRTDTAGDGNFYLETVPTSDEKKLEVNQGTRWKGIKNFSQNRSEFYLSKRWNII